MAVFRTSTSQLHCTNYLDAHCENPFPTPRYFLHCSDTPGSMIKVIAVKLPSETLQHSVSALKYVQMNNKTHLSVTGDQITKQRIKMLDIYCRKTFVNHRSLGKELERNMITSWTDIWKMNSTGKVDHKVVQINGFIICISFTIHQCKTSQCTDWNNG